MRAEDGDDALETLFLPFIDGTLAWPSDGALFLRARDGWPLHQRAWPALRCEQSFRPAADALERSGLSLAEEDETSDLEARIATLTPSQLRILVGLKQGRLNKQIAWDLGVTEATIKAHLTGVFRKLGVHNRTQAVIVARSLELEG